jgi:hypothetical protein
MCRYAWLGQRTSTHEVSKAGLRETLGLRPFDERLLPVIPPVAAPINPSQLPVPLHPILWLWAGVGQVALRDNRTCDPVMVACIFPGHGQRTVSERIDLGWDEELPCSLG